MVLFIVCNKKIEIVASQFNRLIFPHNFFIIIPMTSMYENLEYEIQNFIHTEPLFMHLSNI